MTKNMKNRVPVLMMSLWVMLCVAVALLSVPLGAQTFYGSVVGTVTDTSGAAVPEASVVLTNPATNESKNVHSDAQGNFHFLNLVPATYKVQIEKSEYKRFVRDGVQVQVGSSVRVDVALEVGAVSETVEVSTTAPLLQTESGTLGSQVEGKTVQEMPLNGRNTMNLIALAAGVIPQGATNGGTGINQQGGNTNGSGWGNYQIGGGIAGQSATYVDGAGINTLNGNSVALVPTQDSIQEFNVASNSVSADFGRFAGGVVNMTTKSGTNQWHGSAYEYMRNNALNANGYFYKRQGLKRPQWNQNQYGATLNGPVMKDKLFFMFTWEGFKARTSKSSSLTVPTELMRQGLLSSTATINTANLPNAACIQNVTVNGTAYKQIASSCINATSKIMLDYWSHPNYSGSTNYYANGGLADNQNQYNLRLDYNLSANQRLFARYTQWLIKDKSFHPFPDNTIFPMGNAGSRNRTIQAVVGDTITLNPTTILDLRLSGLHQFNGGIPEPIGVDSSKLLGSGYSKLVNSQTANGGLGLYPALTMTGNYSLASISSGYSMGYANSYAVGVSVTKIKAAHTIKAGVEVRMMDYNKTPSVGGGTFTFSTAGVTGNEFADFLLGYPQKELQSVAAGSSAYNWYQGYYVTDTWQINRKLTANIGLRWELPGGIGERKDRATVLLPENVDPYTLVKGTLGLTHGTMYLDRTLQKVSHNFFTPRLGLSYRVASNFVVRAGYGMSFLPPDLKSSSGSMPSSSPVNSATTANTYSGSGVSNINLSTPFSQNSSITLPSARSASFMTSYVNTASSRQSISGPMPTNPFPYVQQWNVSMSRQFKGDIVVDLGYVGAKGTHLPATSGILNQLSPAIVQQYKDAGTVNTLHTTSNVSIVTPYKTFTNQLLGNSLRPYPYYDTVTDANSNWGSTTYNGLIVRVEKRFKSGGMVSANYTMAKMIGDTDTLNSFLETKAGGTTAVGGTQNAYDHKGDRSVLSYNTPGRLVASYVMPLPFGDGQKYARLSGVAGKLVSGWAVNGITTFQVGYPLVFAESSTNKYTGNFGAGQLRPNYDKSCSLSKSGSAQSRSTSSNTWFNTSCFTAPGSYDFGNAARVITDARAMGIANWDFSVLKSTKVTEKVNAQFRAEFFNIANRVQFIPPVTTRGSSNFGQITDQANQPRLIQFSMRVAF